MRHGLTAGVTTKSSAYVFLARILYLLPVMAVIVVSLFAAEAAPAAMEVLSMCGTC